MKKQVKTIKGFATKETAQVVNITKLKTVKGGEGQTQGFASGLPTEVSKY